MAGAFAEGNEPMKMFVDAPQIYLYRQPVDFRNSIHGLSQIVEAKMELSPFSGVLFLFTNKAMFELTVVRNLTD